jgi:hypothetical protein
VVGVEVGAGVGKEVMGVRVGKVVAEGQAAVVRAVEVAWVREGGEGWGVGG